MEKILEKTLSRVMAHLQVQAGEIFLREENEREFRLALHRGDFSEALFHPGVFWLGRDISAWWPRAANPNSAQTCARHALPAPGSDRRRLPMHRLHPNGRAWQVVGVMTVATRRECHLGERELNLLTGHRQLGRHRHRKRPPAAAGPPAGRPGRARADRHGPA